jgi:hypothetical protein
MRKSLFILALPVFLLTVAPVRAQLRTDAARLKQARAASLADADGRTGLLLNKLFSPEHFQMGHSVEFSSTVGAGAGYSVGAYTNSLQWRFDRLDARVDVSLMTPFGSGFGLQSGRPQVFLRNAEVRYRPTSSAELRLSFQQSPYGAYVAPGMNGWYGRRHDAMGWERER